MNKYIIYSILITYFIVGSIIGYIAAINNYESGFAIFIGMIVSLISLFIIDKLGFDK